MLIRGFRRFTQISCRFCVSDTSILNAKICVICGYILSVSETVFPIIVADHTGITVSNLERSLAFWRDVLGFEFSHTAHQKGELAQEITGVEGAEIKLAVLRAPGGHKIELLEYLAPADRKRADIRPCDVGSVHVALLVHDLDAVLERIAASDWKAAGKSQRLQSGPNAGKRVVYVRDPDGTTIELMQIAKESSSTEVAD